MPILKPTGPGMTTDSSAILKLVMTSGAVAFVPTNAIAYIAIAAGN